MDNKFSAFPGNSTEALAMLWLQQQDLTGKSPAEIYDMYRSAYTEIHKKSNSRNLPAFISGQN